LLLLTTICFKAPSRQRKLFN